MFGVGLQWRWDDEVPTDVVSTWILSLAAGPHGMLLGVQEPGSQASSVGMGGARAGELSGR